MAHIRKKEEFTFRATYYSTVNVAAVIHRNY